MPVATPRHLFSTSLLGTSLLCTALFAGCSGGDDPDGTGGTGTADAAAAATGSPEQPGGSGQVLQPGRPGEANTTHTAAPEVAVPEANEADVTFAQDMIVHHLQALEMVNLVDGRLTDPQVAALADRIRAAQAPEIDTMARWLVQHDAPVPEAAQQAGVDLAELGAEPLEHGGGSGHGDHGGAHAEMPGMATPEQLAELGSAEGVVADRMFLELMIAHHEGALAMAAEQTDSGSDLVISELALGIYAEQQAEIGRMTDLLERLEGR